MSLLVRKIELAKWKQNKIAEGEPPSADAITCCIRTSQNSLSVWYISDMEQLDEAVLAIASGLQKPDTLNFLVLESTLLEEAGLRIGDLKSVRTPYETFKENHRDIIELDYCSLGIMANIIIDHVKNEKYIRFGAQKIKNLLNDGLNKGKIKMEALDKKMQEKLSPPPAAN